LETDGTFPNFLSGKTENVSPVTSFCYQFLPSNFLPLSSRNKKSSPLLSIFPALDDYRMNDPARKAVLLAPTRRRRTMKYICLGYLEPGKFEGMTEDERHRTFDECFEYNDHLRANGHLVAEVPLQPPQTALTLYWKNGKVATTDGPYAETKEQLGGIQILEARDLNHAVQLVSQQPGFKYGLGPIEIRPVVDLSEIIKESEQRRRRKDTSR
jgi:hypothetical protein